MNAAACFFLKNGYIYLSKNSALGPALRSKVQHRTASSPPEIASNNKKTVGRDYPDLIKIYTEAECNRYLISEVIVTINKKVMANAVTTGKRLGLLQLWCQIRRKELEPTC